MLGLDRSRGVIRTVYHSSRSVRHLRGSGNWRGRDGVGGQGRASSTFSWKGRRVSHNREQGLEKWARWRTAKNRKAALLGKSMVTSKPMDSFRGGAAAGEAADGNLGTKGTHVPSLLQLQEIQLPRRMGSLGTRASSLCDRLPPVGLHLDVSLH